MKTIQLNSDNAIPVIGLGTWKSPVNDVYNAVRWAIKTGYRHIDCAAIYDNEAVIGQALHDAIAENDVTRQELFITSKLWNNAHAPADVRPAFEKSLNDLQLDYLDLYLMHWPVAQDAETGETVPLSEIPLEITWAEMEKLVQTGVVRSIGVSNFSVKKLQNLIDAAQLIPSVNQVENHPFLQQNALIDFCTQHNIAVTAYAPLGSGDRPADIKGQNEPSLLNNDIVTEIAKRVSATPAQVLLAFQLNRGLIVIPKSTNFDRIQENFDAQNVVLDDEDMDALRSLEKNFRYVSGNLFKGDDYTPDRLWDE